MFTPADDATLAHASGLFATDVAAPAPRAPLIGDVIGRYQLRRLLGEGGMSQVYLARDMVLGRSVALKLIRARRVSPAEAKVFIGEAQVTSRLNHPNIVQLYDAGLQGDGAFLALEYLDGETLRERMRRGLLTIDESFRIAAAVAAALQHAHAAHVYHCDLKPSNVMLPSDGRARLLDFGLATMVGDRAVLGGTPDWMAPEQWRHEPATDRVDIWALGVLVHQLLTGEHPFGDGVAREVRKAHVLEATRPPAPLVRAGVPDAIRGLVARSLDRAPLARPTAQDWAEALRAATTVGTLTPASESPFRGLAAFEERHTQYYFGREAEIDAFLERMRHRATLPVVGPSGAGKTSFLRAGVIPRLRARQRWYVLTMRPGAEPFVALARQLLAAGEDVTDSQDPDAAAPGDAGHEAVTALAAALRGTPSLLAARLATLATARRASVLLVCDQLEELFTQAHDPDDPARFVRMLTTAADDPDDRVRVTYSLRDDFLGHMPEIEHVFVLRRLTPDALRRTVTGPLERIGYRFEEPALVDAMLDELHGSPFDLPLLQFACNRLWESRDTERQLLLAASYREYGGVARALAQHADAVLAELPPRLHALARPLFGALVTPSRTRKTAPLAGLLANLAAGTDAVIDHLVAGRLLIRRRDADADRVVIEIAHESLITTWAQLARWLEESHEERRLLHDLEEAAAWWRARGRRVEHTQTEEELIAARERLLRLGITPPPPVAEFLAAGELRRQGARRRRRARAAIVLGVAIAISGGSLWLAETFRAQKVAAEAQATALALAGANTGQLDLTVHVIDAVPGGASIPPELLPDLAIHLYAPSPEDAHLPGEALTTAHVTRAQSRFRIEAPGGPAYLRIDGRGRAGERCAASWIRIQSLPGYASRGQYPQTATIRIPSCAASAAGTVQIPAGEFIYGGPGEPATRYAEYIEPEQTVALPTFAVDRTEVPNSVFDAFGSHAALTGEPLPQYPPSGTLGGGPTEPVTAIDAYEAEAFCRYMGKRLPSDYEWTKAARGGLVIDGAPNPAPRRLYPWGTAPAPGCVNLDGDADGYAWAAPVDSQPCGASPYGILHMADNAGEWISRVGMTDQSSPLREIRGGTMYSPRELEQHTTVFRNQREARMFDFGVGIRCVTDGDPEQGSRWTTH